MIEHRLARSDWCPRPHFGFAVRNLDGQNDFGPMPSGDTSGGNFSVLGLGWHTKTAHQDGRQLAGTRCSEPKGTNDNGPSRV